MKPLTSRCKKSNHRNKNSLLAAHAEVIFKPNSFLLVNTVQLLPVVKSAWGNLCPHTKFPLGWIPTEMTRYCYEKFAGKRNLPLKGNTYMRYSVAEIEMCTYRFAGAL